ncbi:MAG: hypothetical protein IID44_10850 [Planctomycetes bacterium]|nr:hypothetical protein [Planctomycetota bacterium]
MTTVYESDVPASAGRLPTIDPPSEFLVECDGQPAMRGKAADTATAEVGYRACLGSFDGEVTVREIIKNPPPVQEKSVAELLADADAAMAAVDAALTEA